MWSRTRVISSTHLEDWMMTMARQAIPRMISESEAGHWGPLAPCANATLTHAGTNNSPTRRSADLSGISGTCNVSNSASATVTAHKCSISLTKTPDKTDICSGANTSVTYTYVVTNTG